MAALSEETKTFVVQALACFDTPTQVIEDVKQEYGVVMTRQQINAYNPATKNGARMSERLKLLFASTRKAFLDDASKIPIANQNFRLRALDRLYHNAAQRGNTVLAAQMIEQAAKEAGGQFTNKQQVNLNGNLSLHRNAQELSDDELAAIAGSRSA